MLMLSTGFRRLSEADRSFVPGFDSTLLDRRHPVTQTRFRICSSPSPSIPTSGSLASKQWFNGAELVDDREPGFEAPWAELSKACISPVH